MALTYSNLMAGMLMNKIKKNITVRFFSITAERPFFDNFSSNYVLNHENDSNTRMLNIRKKKHLIKVINSQDNNYFLSVVKERNTWQTKATRDGTIHGLSINQGIIGDPYYFMVVPSRKIILGFTTGPIGSLKSVGKIILDQFNANRKEEITLSLIPKEKEYSTLQELPEYSSLHFKINSSSLIDLADSAPELIKNLSTAPYINNNTQLSLDLVCHNSMDSVITSNNIIEIVNYLSENDACTVLKVKGIDKNGKNVSLDFGNAFINYKTEIHTRNKYIDEMTSITILKSALKSIYDIN